MRSFDFAPLLRSSIGFENLNRLVDLATRGEAEAYPPYNIEKVGEDAYRISMATAGFSRDELDITAQDNVLIVTGRAIESAEGDSREFLHRGIGKRAFERRFQLADTIKVTGAAYNNGLLDIQLVREVPEHKKPRTIQIDAAQSSDGQQQTIDAVNDRQAA
ncbi:MAG TPA: Hsp20 family protein [Sphingomonas sp.]|nr:Hsp20 family protein [Sphingomonas sp.]